MLETTNLDSLRKTQTQSTTNKSNQYYYPKTAPQKADSIELSAKKEPVKKGFKKYIIAGLTILGGGLAIAFGIKHMNAKKVRELEEKARQEAERIRQQAEEAKRQAEEAKRQAEEAKRKAEELAHEETRKAEEKAKEETKIIEEQPTEITQPEPVETKTPIEEIKEPKNTKTEPAIEEVKNEPVVESKEKAETTPTVEEQPIKQETDNKINEPIETKGPAEEVKESKNAEVKPVAEEVKNEPKIEEKTEEIHTEPKVETSQRIKTVRPKGISKAMNTALDFGEDLTELVNNKNATPEEIQKLVQKHFKNDNIRIHGMSEYDGAGVNAQRKAATTRPFFNESGNLESIDIFVPDLDYNNPDAVMEFISKTTHEMTHVSQFLAKDGTDAEHLKPTMEGRFLNWAQKIITDKYTDKLPMDMIKELFREKGIVPKSSEDVNKFFDSPNPDLSIEKISETLKLGRNDFERKQNVNAIFDVLVDPMLEQMAPRDPNVQSLMIKHGGFEGLKSEIKRICTETFKNEQEAYQAEEIMRQSLSGNAGKDTNYGIIHKIMGICADALG